MRKLTIFVLMFVSIMNMWAVIPQTVEDLKKMEERVKDAVNKATQATVAIVTSKGNTGSGVIVNEKGLIFTASHVVMGEEKVMVILSNGKTVTGTVLGANYTRDEAVVQIAVQDRYPFVPLGNSDNLKVGDYVVALGHSAGFDPVRRSPVRIGRMETDGKQRFLISECTLIGGDSGGPLLDLNGHLIGIHSSIGSTLQINNHIPISAFIKDQPRLLKGEYWGELGTNLMEDPEAAVLGVVFIELDGREGVMVKDIYEDSPAAQVGLLPGDMILQMRGHEIKNMKDLVRELCGVRVGEPTTMVVQRGKDYYRADIVPIKRSELKKEIKRS